MNHPGLREPLGPISRPLRFTIDHLGLDHPVLRGPAWITISGRHPGPQRGLEKAFWDSHGLLALPRPLRDLEGLLSLGLWPPFVELAAGLDGGHGAGPPRPTQQLLQVLPLHAPIRPNTSPFPCF